MRPAIFHYAINSIFVLAHGIRDRRGLSISSLTHMLHNDAHMYECMRDCVGRFVRGNGSRASNTLGRRTKDRGYETAVSIKLHGVTLEGEQKIS